MVLVLPSFSSHVVSGIEWPRVRIASRVFVVLLLMCRHRLLLLEIVTSPDCRQVTQGRFREVCPPSRRDGRTQAAHRRRVGQDLAASSASRRRGLSRRRRRRRVGAMIGNRPANLVDDLSRTATRTIVDVDVVVGHWHHHSS